VNKLPCVVVLHPFHHLLLSGWGTWMDGWQDGWRDEWMERADHTGQTKDIIILLVGTRDLRTLWSPPISLNQERHTQRCKAANFIFILFIYFCDENLLKSPPWKHTWWSEHFGKFSKKKTKSPHFQEGKKNSFEIATFWGEKKQVLKSQICGGFGQIPSFLLFKHVYERRANPNPLTPKEDDWTDRHLKYYR
jgi:hypothetical protein